MLSKLRYTFLSSAVVSIKDDAVPLKGPAILISKVFRVSTTHPEPPEQYTFNCEFIASIMLIKSSWINSCATRSIGEWKYTVTRSSCNGLHSLTCIVIPTLFDPWKGSFSLTNDMILSSLEVRNWKGFTFSGSRFNLKTLKGSLIEVWTQEACRLWSDTARWKIADGEVCKWMFFMTFEQICASEYNKTWKTFEISC